MLWPYDRLTVAAGNHEKTLSDRGGTVVTCAEFSPLDGVAISLEGFDPRAERSAPALFAWTESVGGAHQWPPRGKLFDVFEDDDSRANLPCPPLDDPR